MGLDAEGSIPLTPTWAAEAMMGARITLQLLFAFFCFSFLLMGIRGKLMFGVPVLVSMAPTPSRRRATHVAGSCLEVALTFSPRSPRRTA
jgi:hypothetical protein